MKQIIRTACIAIASMAIFSSCKKDDNKSRTELLTSSNWKLVLAQERTNGTGWVNVTDDYDDCELDNLIRFSTPDLVTIDEGATKCNPADPQTSLGTWSFENGEEKLNLDGEVFDVDELSGSTLAISFTEAFGGVTYTYQLVLKH